jgi:FtsZ-interacting cell division protein ZipA
VDSSDTNYVDGKLYTVDVTLSEVQTYTYTFNVKNVRDQTASLGPLEGPIVTKKASTAKAGMLPDFLWIILLIIIAIVVAIIGYLVGARKKKKEPEDERHGRGQRTHPSERPDGLREAPMVPLTSDEEVGEPEKEAEVPSGAPIQAHKMAATGTKASAEEPASSVEDAKEPPADKPGPPDEAETKPELKEHQSDSEAPASDKDIQKEPEAPKPEEKKPEQVDQDIDAILDKLDK